jgi:hypothetical protein
MKTRFALVAAIAAFAGSAHADILWTFNSLPSDNASNTGTLSAEIGTGTASVFGGATSTFASGNASGGSSDPDATNNDSGWNLTTWAAQGAGSGTRGAQFDTNTLGLGNIVLAFDIRHSNTSSRFVQVSYNLGDGNGYQTAGLAAAGIFEATNGGDVWYNNRTLALPASANNLSSISLRISPIFAPGTSAYATATSTSAYGTAGTLRFDYVSIVPTPGSLALLGMGLFAAARRRTK